MPDYGVEAIWRKPGRPEKVASVAGVSIRAVEHRMPETCERADPATRDMPEPCPPKEHRMSVHEVYDGHLRRMPSLAVVPQGRASINQILGRKHHNLLSAIRRSMVPWNSAEFAHLPRTLYAAIFFLS